MKWNDALAFAILTVFVLGGCTAAAPPAPATELEEPPPTEAPVATGVIVISDVDADDPVNKLEQFQPLANYLAANLGDYGIGVGEVKIAPDLDTLIQWINDDEVDLYYDSPFPAMVLSDATGAQPILRGWRGGEPVYHTVFFAPTASGIVSLEDLQGKVVAYDDPSSTSGFMMPTSYLIANGLTPVEVNSPESAVGDDEVGYVFAGDDEVTLEWVVSGRVAAGVVDNLTYAEDLPEETRAQLTIIAETEDVARRVLMVRAGLDPELVAAIQDLFINLENVPEGAGILDTLSTVRFDEFPEGADAVLQTMRDMYTLVENQ